MPSGIRFYLKGIFYTLTHPSLWKYIIYQLIVAVFILIGVSKVGYDFYQKRVAIAKFSWILEWLSIGGITITCLFIYVFLNNIFTSIFMKQLSEKVEFLQTGKVASYKQRNNLIEIIIYFPFSLARTFIELIISFVPIIGQWWGFYKVGKESVKGTLERRIDKDKLTALYAQNHITLVFFGMLSTLVLIAFPLTLLYLPLRVVGGTLLALELVKFRF